MTDDSTVGREDVVEVVATGVFAERQGYAEEVNDGDTRSADSV